MGGRNPELECLHRFPNLVFLSNLHNFHQSVKFPNVCLIVVAFYGSYHKPLAPMGTFGPYRWPVSAVAHGPYLHNTRELLDFVLARE